MVHKHLKSIANKVLNSSQFTQQEKDVARVLLGKKPVTDEMKGYNQYYLVGLGSPEESKAYWAQVRRDEFYEPT